MKQKFFRRVAFLLASIFFVGFVGCERHNCVYDKKIQEQVYFKSEATCRQPKQYYYSCSCGKHGEETFSVGIKSGHDFSAEIANEEYLSTPANCVEAAKYFKSCSTCGLTDYRGTFSFGEKTGVCEYTKEVAKANYLKSKATLTESAVYYKSCVCGAKGEETFVYGTPLRYDYTEEEKLTYTPTSLTITLYDTGNFTYGFTYNTQSKPLRPVLQIQKGNSLTEDCEEFSVDVVEANGYYIAKTEVVLEDCTTYTYRAYDKYVDVGTQPAVFTTKNTKSTTFTFAHVSDSQEYPTEFGYVLKNTTETADFLLHTGDVVQVGSDERQWKDMLDGNFEYLSKIPMMAISGNHETVYQGCANETFKHFHNKIPSQYSTEKGYFYSFVYGNTKFIMLNTNDLIGNQLRSEQYDWLVSELKNNTATWTIVAMHNPMYSAGKYGVDPSMNGVALALQQQLQALFMQYKVDLVLQGHDHAISRTRPINAQGVPQQETEETVNDIKYSVNPQGVIYVMDGTAGGQVRGTRAYEFSLYKYAQGSYASSWAEYEIEGNTMKVTVKYFQNGQVNVCRVWGIKKSL